MDFVTQDHHKKLLDSFIITENCIIAEIYRISSIIPLDFVDPMSSKFSRVIVDFSFFENKPLLEKYVEETEEGRRLDENFYNQFSNFCNKFSKLLDTICLFVFDFVEYSEGCLLNQNVLDKRFVELNVLRCEVLYLLGIMLILLESKFPGVVKERIFVAYYRSGTEFPIKNFELLVSFLRNRKESYETCFKHLKINQGFVEHAINFLKSYTTLEEANFSHSHFSREKLAAMAYTCLYFKLELLESNFVVMRQFVDKYFADKWIIPLHVELKVNLREKWYHFKAANAALTNTVEPAVVHCVVAEYSRSIRNIHLPSGLLAVECMGEYSKLIFEYNQCLQWLILHFTFNSHSNQQQQQIKKQLCNLDNVVNSATQLKSSTILALLTKLAAFEYKFRQSCQFLIERKTDDSSRLKSRILSVFDQIIAFLSSSSVEVYQWNDKLQQWLGTIKECVMGLDISDANSAHVLEHLKGKIAEVGELYSGDHIILQQYFSLLTNELDRLLSICLIDKVFLERLTQRTCSIYLFSFLTEQIGAFEELLKRDALAVKFVFLKISASITNLVSPIRDPIKREILSTFYHKKLEYKLKLIIQVIPRAIFLGMDELKELFSTTKLIHIEKSNIKELADMSRRRLLAKKTFAVTKLSLGISEMCIKRLGEIEIKSRDLLFDGLNTELDIKLKKILGTEAENILSTLCAQMHQMEALRKAFLFVCEYIGINGVAMWQNKLQYLINIAIRDAQTNYLNAKNLIGPSPSIVLNRNHRLAIDYTNIIINIVDYMLTMTSPKTTNYHCLCNEWWSSDARTKLSFTMDFFTIVERWLPGTALSGFRRIIPNIIIQLIKQLQQELEKVNTLIQQMASNQPTILHQQFIDQLATSAPFLEIHKRMLTLLSRIGQLKIVEENIYFVMEENKQSRMQGIANASKNLLRILEHASANSNNNNSSKIIFSNNCVTYFKEFIAKTMPTGYKVGSQQNASIALFTSLVVYFSTNVITNKKSEQLDAFATLYGLMRILQVFGIQRQFETLMCLFINDSKILGVVESMQHMSTLLKTSTIPKALTK